MGSVIGNRTAPNKMEQIFSRLWQRCSALGLGTWLDLVRQPLLNIKSILVWDNRMWWKYNRFFKPNKGSNKIELRMNSLVFGLLLGKCARMD